MALLDSLLNTIGVGKVSEMISEKFGIDKSKVQTVVAIALPLLITALIRNTRSQQGADSLHNAVTNDHDGSILGNLGNLFSPSTTQDGSGILGHLLGGSQNNVINNISQQTGIGGSQVSGILGSLAPLLMGFLGQQQNSNNMSSNDLGNLVQNMGQEVSQNQPGLLGNLTNMMDQNGNGPMDEIMNMGKGLLGGLFNN